MVTPARLHLPEEVLDHGPQVGEDNWNKISVRYLTSQEFLELS